MQVHTLCILLQPVGPRHPESPNLVSEDALLPLFHVTRALSNQQSWPKWLLYSCLKFRDLSVSKPRIDSVASFPYCLSPLQHLGRQICRNQQPMAYGHHRGAPEAATISPLFFFLLSLSLSFIIPLTLPSHLKIDLRLRPGRLVVIELSKAIYSLSKTKCFNEIMRLAKEAFLNKELQTAFEVCQ